MLSLETVTNHGRLDYVIEYGSDSECKTMLESIADSLGLDTVESLRDKIETLESEKTDLEYERDDANDNCKLEVKRSQALHTVANGLAMALIDLMAQVKTQPMPDSIIKACDAALDAFEAV